jgi:hypothetical protein
MGPTFHSMQLGINNDGDIDVKITLANDCVIAFRRNKLISVSIYFARMFSRDDFKESVSNVVNLSHLSSEALKFVLDAAITQGNSSVQFCKNIIDKIESSIINKAGEYISNHEWEDDYTTILQVVDYLQITGVTDTDLNRIYQAVEIYKSPEVLREEFKKQDWVSHDSPFCIISIPNSKKKREWRFWVLYVLCLDMMPIENIHLEPTIIVQALVPFGDAIAIRRELVEYGLMEREGDGSAYWRPPYTISLIYNQLHKQDTGTFQRRII